MKTLRITQSRVAAGCDRVEIALEGDSQARQTVTSDFQFELRPQDQEDIRWYLEEYLQFPCDPAPKIAARVERRIADVGKELFESTFSASQQGQRLWAKVYESLSDLRIEIASSVSEGSTIPWEFMRDPLTDTVLALRARCFVRSYTQATEAPSRIADQSGSIRILLVICRPWMERDVPFRSVANRLVKALTDEARQQFHLHVLRPPTYQQLAQKLREAKARGKPYNVVHFDGHGVYTDQDRLVPLMLSGKRNGLHGYLVFENAEVAENMHLVDGGALGKLLLETDCRRSEI